MISRIGLFVASLVAAGTLALALVAGHVWPASTSAPVAAVAVSDGAAAALAPTPQIDTVYLAPPAPQQTITIHRVVSGGGGEGEGHEGAGDD